MNDDINPGDVDSIMIMSMALLPGCLACAFTIEGFVDAMHEGVFPLCRAHLLRAGVYMESDGNPRAHLMMVED